MAEFEEGMVRATQPKYTASLDQAKAAYEPPVLREHGALRDLTNAFVIVSNKNLSDVRLKENIVAVSWAPIAW